MAKLIMPDLQRCLKKPESDQKVYISVSFSIASYKQEIHFTFAKKLQIKIKSLKKQKQRLQFITWSDKAYKGTGVNQALSSCYGGSLEITRTVPLIIKVIIFMWLYNRYLKV